MNRTKIEWADATWNPVTGCLHGCEYCYARRLANRFSSHGKVMTDFGDWESKKYRPGLYAIARPAYIYEGNGQKGRHIPYPFEFHPTLHKYRMEEPTQEKKPCTIFVCSMADLFGDWVPDEWIKAVFEACAKAPQHRYLFLTKNPKRYVKLYEKAILPVGEGYWYGSTCTGPDVPFYYSRMPDDNPNTFASIEPLLKPFGHIEAFPNWVIIGAETGNRKGKVIPEKEWVDSIVRQARKRFVPVFMKDSLLPVMGEENMLREFPWDKNAARRAE